MKHYELWYTKEAPYGNENFLLFAFRRDIPDDGWEKWSLPIGNGYMGVNVFGRTETERLQITENSLCNPIVYKDHLYPGGNGGLQNFCECYLDFGHTDVQNYRRSLSLNQAVAKTEYSCNGVHYTREHFASYPDKVFVTKITTDKKNALQMTVRPEIPFVSSTFGLFSSNRLSTSVECYTIHDVPLPNIFQRATSNFAVNENCDIVFNIR